MNHEATKTTQNTPIRETMTLDTERITRGNNFLVKARHRRADSYEFEIHDEFTDRELLDYLKYEEVGAVASCFM